MSRIRIHCRRISRDPTSLSTEGGRHTLSLSLSPLGCTHLYYSVFYFVIRRIFVSIDRISELYLVISARCSSAFSCLHIEHDVKLKSWFAEESNVPDWKAYHNLWALTTEEMQSGKTWFWFLSRFDSSARRPMQMFWGLGKFGSLILDVSWWFLIS